MANKPNPIGDLTPEQLDRFWLKVDKTPGHGPRGDCHLWTKSVTPDGYGHLGINGCFVLAHRVAYVLGHGNTSQLILHTCDMPRCVNVAHLYAGSHTDNSQDTVKRGRFPNRSGENNPCAKVSDVQRDEIRSLHASGEFSYRSIGARFGLHNTTVMDIVRSHAWSR